MTATTPDPSVPPSPEPLGAAARRLPVLAELSEAGRSAVASMSSPRSFDEGALLLEQGKRSESFFILLEGRLKMSRHLTNGRSVLLALFSPGEVVGAVAAIGGRPSDATVEALEPSSCLEIPRRELLRCFETRPTMIGELLPVLTRELVECRNCIVELTFFRVELRFAKLFLKLADAVGRRRRAGTFIPVPLTRQELADMTGTTVETAIRIMSRWGKEGMVETAKDGFVVRDRPALEALAGD